MNRDRIRCFQCREYDHFANECPNVGTDDSNGYESDRAALQLMTTEADIHDNFDTTRLTEESEYSNLCRVRMVPPHFCLKLRKVNKLDLMTRSHTYQKEKKCLTEDQARHIYKRVEMVKLVNIETMTQEVEDDKLIRNRFKEKEDENESNPYQMAILNKKSKDDVKIEQMINWSIFSDSIKYVDGSSCSDVTPILTVRPLHDRKHGRLYNNLKTDEDLTADIIFEEGRVRDAYFDIYDGIHAKISQATKFDESTDLSTTYLGKIDMTREYMIKAEERFPISGQEYTVSY